MPALALACRNNVCHEFTFPKDSPLTDAGLFRIAAILHPVTRQVPPGTISSPQGEIAPRKKQDAWSAHVDKLQHSDFDGEGFVS